MGLVVVVVRVSHKQRETHIERHALGACHKRDRTFGTQAQLGTTDRPGWFLLGRAGRAHEHRLCDTGNVMAVPEEGDGGVEDGGTMASWRGTGDDDAAARITHRRSPSLLKQILPLVVSCAHSWWGRGVLPSSSSRSDHPFSVVERVPGAGVATSRCV